jgi:hypothetical protein
MGDAEGDHIADGKGRILRGRQMTMLVVETNDLVSAGHRPGRCHGAGSEPGEDDRWVVVGNIPLAHSDDGFDRLRP